MTHVCFSVLLVIYLLSFEIGFVLGVWLPSRYVAGTPNMNMGDDIACMSPGEQPLLVSDP